MSQLDMSINGLEVSNFVSGTWVKGNSAPLDLKSPYTGNVCGSVSYADSNLVNSAITKASEAQRSWGIVPMKARAQVLFKFREILLREEAKISQVIALENGKTVAEARAGLMKGVEVLEYALSLQNSDLGGKLEVSRGVYCEYKREAIGVVAGITPFNFPAMVPMWSIPIAIALGNAYVWKPSEKTPLTSKYIADAFHEAGLPDGVLTVLQGERDVVEAIIDHPETAAVSFVGSTKIAKLVYQRATSLGKRALCLGGAKNHIILLPDADLDVTGIGISDSYTGCAGQRCMAAAVLLAVGDVDQHIKKIIERSKSQKLGETMGAIITNDQLEFLNKAIDNALNDGATLLLDGRMPEVTSELKGGNWIAPTILDNVAPGSEAAATELFGPILTIIRCNNITEAIEIQNASPYGNAASVFTSSGPMAEYVASRAQCGMFGVNIGVPVPREPFSFGGVKASKFGHGDITGDHCLDFWTNVKKITTKWENQKDHNWMS